MRVLFSIIFFLNSYATMIPFPYTYTFEGAVTGQNYTCATNSSGLNIPSPCTWLASGVLSAQDASNNKTTFTFKTNWFNGIVPVCSTTQFAITSITVATTVVGNQTVYVPPVCEISGCGCEDWTGDGCPDSCQCSGQSGDDWCCYLRGETRGYQPTTGNFTLTCHN